MLFSCRRGRLLLISSSSVVVVVVVVQAYEYCIEEVGTNFTFSNYIQITFISV